MSHSILRCQTNAALIQCTIGSARHLILKWRSRQTSKVCVDDTIYWADNRRARNLVLYRKRKAINALRLELRFLNTAAVRRAGWTILPNWRNSIRQRCLLTTLRQWSCSPPTSPRFLTAVNVSPARARHVLDQLDMQHFVSGTPHTERLVQTVSPFEIPTALTWDAVITMPPPPQSMPRRSTIPLKNS